jgi:hypothetical protein
MRLLAKLLRAVDAAELRYWRLEVALLDALGPMGSEWRHRQRGSHDHAD